MSLIHIVYLIGTAAALVAGIPQLRKLLATKQADEFSISTWTIWMISQVTALVYALSTGDLLYAAVSILWLTFYVFMITLILKYRTTPRFVLKKPNLRRLTTLFSEN